MVNTAFITLWGKTVGAIAWDNVQQVASFEYDAAYDFLKWPISPLKLPARRIYSFPELRNSSTFKGMPGLVADSLPDRYGNELINIWLAQNGRPENSLNPVEQLCFIGARGMGALEFVPAIAPKSRTQDIELSGLIAYTKQLLENKEAFSVHTSEGMRDVMLDVLKMGTSAGGARPKAIIAYNEENGLIKSGQTKGGDGFSYWLIKFDGVTDAQFGTSYGYGRVEMAYYKMATDFGIEMMESRLVEEAGRAHFMTKRFDRTDAGEKIHTQTFCGLQHYDFNQIASFSYEQLFQTMRALRLSYAEAEQMYRRVVFNVVARNCDDHTKNFSFQMGKDGIWKLAPAYDICHAYRPDSAWVSQHCLSINGKRKNISKEDLLLLASQHSIRFGERIIQEALQVVARWREYAEIYQVEKKLADAIDATLIKSI